MIIVAGTRPGHNQEFGTDLQHGWQEAKYLGCLLLRVNSWIRNEASCQTRSVTWDASIVSCGLTCCVITPTLIIALITLISQRTILI